VFALADIDLDGDADFVAPLFSTANALTVRNFGDGLFNSGGGCAAGDYWINLNVANVPSGAPDPVPILRSRLDALRADLIGLTDAVRSSAELTPPAIRADGANTEEMVVTLRDWQGSPVSDAPARRVEVTAAAGADFGTIVGPVSLDADGTYHATVIAGTQVGTAGFSVRVQDAPEARAVQLMPAPTLALLHPADWDLSGAVDSNDFMVFLNDFFAGSADYNHDGTCNSQDFFDFLNDFFGV
jgi:hypothetical protein